MRTSLLSSLAFSSAIVSPNSLTTFLHSEAETWKGDMAGGPNPNENLVEVHGEDVVGPCVPLVQRVPQQVEVVKIEVSLASESKRIKKEILKTVDLINLWILVGWKFKLLFILLKLESFLANLDALWVKRTKNLEDLTCSIDFSSRSNVCLISS